MGSVLLPRARAICGCVARTDLAGTDDPPRCRCHAAADGVRGAALRIVQDLVGYPLLTVPDIEQRHGITYQTANQAVAKRADHGLLRQISEANDDRMFASSSIPEVLR